jgi:hypothetical protein
MTAQGSVLKKPDYRRQLVLKPSRRVYALALVFDQSRIGQRCTHAIHLSAKSDFPPLLLRCGNVTLLSSFFTPAFRDGYRLALLYRVPIALRQLSATARPFPPLGTIPQSRLSAWRQDQVFLRLSRQESPSRSFHRGRSRLGSLVVTPILPLGFVARGLRILQDFAGVCRVILLKPFGINIGLATHNP